jgi:hypothetical protein
MKITIIDIPKQRLPEGKHQVTIAKVQPGMNQNGLDFFECTFENANGTFTSRFYTTEKAMYRVEALCEKLGAVIDIQDVNNEYYPQPMYKTLMAVQADGNRENETSPEIDFKKIKLSYVVNTVFEIK